MTCKEKLKIEHPDLVSSPVDRYIAGCCGCPDDYGYAKRPEYCNDGDKNIIRSFI